MEMPGHKWEDLNMDCLVNIFKRVGLENLLLNVPYVCKTWYKATCIPQCWSTLDFTEGLSDEPVRIPLFSTNLDFPEGPSDERNCLYDSDYSDMSSTYSFGFIDEVSTGFVKKYHLKTEESLNGFFKFVAKRGNICVTHLKIPAICTREAMDFISNECPNIKTLQLSGEDRKYGLSYLISKWKRLESLSIPWCYSTAVVFEQLSIHCENFQELEIVDGKIDDDDASAAVTFLLSLKCLNLRSVKITKENLLRILNSCTKLEILDARDCIGFDENDGDVLSATAHFRSVKLQGSTLHRDDSEDYDFQETSNDRDFWFTDDISDFYC